MKKIISTLLVLLMVFSMAVSAYALDVDTKQGGEASVTISNAAKGQTYKIYKLFDATVTGNEGGSIVYTGTIPTELATYFVKEDGYITATDAALDTADTTKFSKEAVDAIEAWAVNEAPVAFQTAEGDVLKFINLQYGLYVVTTEQGSVITVDSTNPNVTVIDKNDYQPGAEKKVDDSDVSIGDTVTYTATFPTANWLLDNKGVSHKVVSYEISDTLPEFLSEVKIVSLIIDADGNFDTTNDQATPISGDALKFTEKKISVPWVSVEGGKHHLYDNGAVIQLKYSAKVTDEMAVDGTEGNVNTVTLQPYVEAPDGSEEPWSKTWEDTATIFTYAALLKKVDENLAPLDGASFAALGLTVEPASENSKGNYVVVSYDPSSQINGTPMYTDANGALYISGLASDVTLTVTEIEAPPGYNKLVGTFEMNPVKVGEVVTSTSTFIYYNADGTVSETKTDSYKSVTEYNANFNTEGKFIEVENQKGLELPSTGGIGTSIFYIIGGVLVLFALVLLITKKRMNSAE